MRIRLWVWLAIVLASMSVSLLAYASECGGSFYCYGETGHATVVTPTRPPPIPPPNTYLRRLQQRNQTQIDLRNRTDYRNAPPVVTRPRTAVTATATRPAAVTRNRTPTNRVANNLTTRAQTATRTAATSPTVTRTRPTTASPANRPANTSRITVPTTARTTTTAIRPTPTTAARATTTRPAQTSAQRCGNNLALLNKAKSLESSAVIAATKGQSEKSKRLFKSAAKARSDAATCQR